MGLGSVELVMAVENHFGVELSDAEFGRCICPANLIDVIHAKVRGRKKLHCPSQHAFYRLRRAVMQVADVPREAVRVDSDLRKFVDGNQSAFWSFLHLHTEAVRWPGLARPGWLVGLLWVMTAGFFGLLLPVMDWTSAGLFAGLVFLSGWIGSYRFRCRIRQAYATPRTLANFMAPAYGGPWSREEVAALVKEETLARCTAKANRYHERAEFYRDLGLE